MGGRKDPSKPEPPKKAMCAFFLYLKDQFPGYRITDITREIGEMWKVLDPSKKEQYEKKAAKEKERVTKEREHYQARFGKPQNKKKRKRKMKQSYEAIKKYLNAKYPDS